MTELKLFILNDLCKNFSQKKFLQDVIWKVLGKSTKMLTDWHQ